MIYSYRQVPLTVVIIRWNLIPLMQTSDTQDNILMLDTIGLMPVSTECTEWRINIDIVYM